MVKCACSWMRVYRGGLRSKLPGHEVRTAPELGWGDLDNGDLLAAMADQFDALVTVDNRLPHEQAIAPRRFGVIVLRAKSNRFVDLLPLAGSDLDVVIFPWLP